MLLQVRKDFLRQAQRVDERSTAFQEQFCWETRLLHGKWVETVCADIYRVVDVAFEQELGRFCGRRRYGVGKLSATQQDCHAPLRPRLLLLTDRCFPVVVVAIFGWSTWGHHVQRSAGTSLKTVVGKNPDERLQRAWPFPCQ